MKNILPLFLTAILLSAISCDSKEKDHVDQPEWISSINEQVKSWIDSESILGAEILIVKDDKTALHEVYGWDDRDNNILLVKDQIFRIHSMTKPFTGTAILMLSEEGKLSLDDKVSEYLEAYRNDNCRDITIRQLLNHTAGFTQPAYPKGSIDLYESLGEAVMDLAEAGPKYEPGREYHYSDGHTASLGLIVAEITGEPAEKFIEERIFKPLGMKNSYCSLEGDEPDRDKVVDTYYWREGSYKKLWDNEDEPETPFFRASGGIATTAEDYSKFLSCWMKKGKYNGGQLLSEETIIDALQTGEPNNAYGMHWEIYHELGNQSKMPVFGHGGSSGTLAMALPEQNAMVFYFTQSRGTLTGNFLTRFILEELEYQEKKMTADMEISKSFLDRAKGDYLVGPETWILDGNPDKLIFKSGRLVPLEFLPRSDSVFINRFMDMKLIFDQIEENKEIGSFIFQVNGSSVPVSRATEKDND